MIRVLVVDDEAPARSRLRRLLEPAEDVEIVGEAVDGSDALRRIEELTPDVVFLDIQMPGSNGLEVARLLPPPRPHIVFCTAFDQHAIDAFELHAIDYLMKPASRAKLDRALERLREKIADEREASAAGAAQRRLLPRQAPNLRSLQVAAYSEPARDVGGDYYDYLPLGEGRLGLVVGDVAGKGMDAGLLMAGLQARLQSLAPLHGVDLPAALTEINRSIEPQTSDARYVTLFGAVLEDGEDDVTFVNAGHNPPLIRRAGGAVEPLKATGLVLGMLPTTVYRPTPTTLGPGDVLVAFSDGITEAHNDAGEEFGEERLADHLRRLPDGAGADEVRDNLLAAWRAFRGAVPADDDATLVAVVRERK